MHNQPPKKQKQVSEFSSFQFQQNKMINMNNQYSTQFSNYKMGLYLVDDINSMNDEQSENWFHPEIQTNLINLFKDVFPYYRLKSSISLVILIQLFVYICLPNSYKTIRPYYRFSFELETIMSWLSSPFTTRSLIEMFIHVIFIMNIGSQLQQKMHIYQKISAKSHQYRSNSSNNNSLFTLKNQHFIVYYIMLCIGSNFLALAILLPLSNSISSNLPSYCIYAYLQFLDHEINLKIFKEEDTMGQNQNNMGFKVEKQQFQQQFTLLRIYKTIIVSYIVFMGQYMDQFHHFYCYLAGIIILAGIISIKQFHKAQ